MAREIKLALRPIDELQPPGEYWQRPPEKEEGDPDKGRIFHAVAAALNSWEGLETACADLFHIFCESESHAAKRAYGAIISAGGRREALHNAAEVFFGRHETPEKWQKSFNKMLAHMQNAATRRNEIAHAFVKMLERDNIARGYFLVPPDYNSNKTTPFYIVGEDSKLTRLRADYVYTSADVLSFIDKFETLKEPFLGYLLFFMNKQSWSGND